MGSQGLSLLIIISNNTMKPGRLLAAALFGAERGRGNKKSPALICKCLPLCRQTSGRFF